MKGLLFRNCPRIFEACIRNHHDRLATVVAVIGVWAMR